MQALGFFWGMQAENLEKEASSEYGTPESEAAGLRLRCNTGEFVAPIHSSAAAFP